MRRRLTLLLGTFACSASPALAAPDACPARLLPGPVMTGKRDITAASLVELRDFGGAENGLGGTPPFSISPDGARAALVVRRADASTDSYCIGLLVVTLDGTAAPRLLDVGGDFIAMTHDLRGVTDIVNGSPKPIEPLWSPDGRRIAWLRRDHGITQVWQVSLDRAAVRQLTRFPTGVSSFSWSRDGRTILAVTRPGLAAGKAEIDREGQSGFLFDRRFWPLSDDRPRPPASIPLVAKAVDIATGAVRDARPDDAPSDPPTVAGALLSAASSQAARAWIAHDDPRLDFSPAPLHVEVDGKQLPCPAAICADHVGALWWAGPAELLFMRGDSPDNGGRTQLYRWRTDRDAAPVRVLDTTDALFGCTLRAGALICARETSTHPRTLVRLDPESGGVQTIFDPNPEFGALRLGKVERLSWTNDRGMPTYGDLVLPPGHKAGERHPLIVVQYQSRGFLRGGTGDEYPVHLLAAQGYAVLSFQRPAMLAATAQARDLTAVQRINIAGLAERRAIVSSLNAGVDAVMALGVADPGRIGITGLSDGAATVQFALSNSDRFKAAAISSCCDDPSTAFFAAGLGYRDDVVAWGYPPPGTQGVDFWRQYSLAANAGRMRTPLLIQVPDAEYRLALETYSTLELHGAPVEMYVYPDEHHVKSHPAHRLAVYERNLAWFDFWLRDRLSTDPARQAEMGRWQMFRPGLAAR